MDLESRGLPSGFVASCEFEQAADAQGKSLGIKPARVFVPHPIQDRTNEEMADIAKSAINEVTALILNK
tara:strand:- start:448 stop:654 length:207 start_codon:yes stop_codon:yes gene_type:complete